MFKYAAMLSNIDRKYIFPHCITENINIKNLTADNALETKLILEVKFISCIKSLIFLINYRIKILKYYKRFFPNYIFNRWNCMM